MTCGMEIQALHYKQFDQGPSGAGHFLEWE